MGEGSGSEPRCRNMSRRAWKTSRPGRDTFPPRPSSGSTSVGTTNANTKALTEGDGGRGPAFRWTTSGRLPSFAATTSDSYVFCARRTIAWRPNMSTGRNSSRGRSMKGGGVGKCPSTGHRCLELHSERAFKERFRKNHINGLRRAAKGLGFTLTPDTSGT